MNKLEQAARQALEALLDYHKADDDRVSVAMSILQEALVEPELNLNCKSVQKRLATVWGYVKAEQAEQEPFDMNDHPPHRLCECRKCMEYFTPLPDCDAFATSGKPIAEQTNTQFMEGYRIGLAEMREKCAKVCEEVDNHFDYTIAARQCAAAIRVINFEGDTGFRPVSEMIAEHKQDPKKAAAIEKAKMRKAEQEPVAAYKDAPRVIYLQTGCEDPEFCECSFNEWGDTTWCADKIHDTDIPYIRADYTRPVRTKDLTDDEIFKTNKTELPDCQDLVDFARAVISADREKNNV